jgi:hypothetical protein
METECISFKPGRHDALEIQERKGNGKRGAQSVFNHSTGVVL